MLAKGSQSASRSYTQSPNAEYTNVLETHLFGRKPRCHICRRVALEGPHTFIGRLHPRDLVNATPGCPEAFIRISV